MCFSSSASFGAGVILTVVGVASIKKVENRRQYVFASIPLLFAFQQFTEGVVWLSLTYPEYAIWQESSKNVFLFFAQIVWPLCVPLSMLLLEKDISANKMLLILTGIGCIVSSYLTYCLFTFPTKSEILGRHIYYSLKYPEELRFYGSIFYFIVTVVPPMFSGVKRMWWIGIAILISYLFTRLFLAEFTVSVWCFFASIISVVVYIIMQDVQLHFKSSTYPIKI